MTNNSGIIDLTIVGGGITGLVSAYLAAKEGKKVRVLEASGSFGGLIKTFNVGGTELECFYHHFFLHDKELNWLINELGLKDSVVSKKTTMGVYTKGKLYPFSTLGDLLKFKPLNILSKARFVLCTAYLGKFSKWHKNEHIPAIEWFKKWSGKQVTESIWKPLLKVKFGKFDGSVPLAWMIGRLKQRLESRESGSEKLFYLDGSHFILLEALLKKLKELDVDLVLNAKVDDLITESNNLKGVRSNSTSYLSEKVLFTIPSHFINQIAKSHIPILQQNNPSIEYFGAICVVLELSESLSPFYWLNVADRDFPFGGIIEHTQFISSELYNKRHIVYLSKYFALDEEIASKEKVEVEQLMIDKLEIVFPDFKKEQVLKTHFFKSNTAATVCDLNFSNKIPRVKSEIENLYVCNMAHVYPDERSVNNSIRIAANACKTMGINTDLVPNGSSLSGLVGFNEHKAN